MKSKELCAFVEALATPLAAEVGGTIWDVEFVKEAGRWYLRVKLDAEDGVSIAMCEHVSRGLDGPLDAADPVPVSYTLEVGSPGAQRVLKEDRHFARYIGHEVEVRLYQPMEKLGKSFTAMLGARTAGTLHLTVEGTEYGIPMENVALCRLHVVFIF